MSKNLLDEIGALLKEIFEKEETWFLLFVAGVVGAILIPFVGLNAVIAAVLAFLGLTWWLWLFIILFILFEDAWLHYRQEDYIHKIRWMLLELRVPRHIEKSPQAMEQVLVAIHSMRNAAGDFREKFIEGEVTRWFSLEMVSFGGEIHFFIRIYANWKSLVEAAFFAYYPDLDIVEVPDYIDRLPKSVIDTYEQGNDLWGTEMVLGAEELYPIRTYSDFEISTEEEKRFDPISTFVETLAKINKDEFIGIEMLIAPTGADHMNHDYDEWKDGFKDKLEELRQQSKKTKKELNPAEGEFSLFTIRSPRQTEILKAVEENLSKPAFETIIRFIYISPRATFSDSYPRRGIAGAFNQYQALDMNSFTQNYRMSTRTKLWQKPHVFPKTRGEYRKARLLYNYKHREIPPERLTGKKINSYFFNWDSSKRFLMNTKCLATLFHVPTAVVLTEPHLKHLESKKSGPPAGLAIFGGDEEIQKYR